jgi:hypothetical protein
MQREKVTEQLNQVKALALSLVLASTIAPTVKAQDLKGTIVLTREDVIATYREASGKETKMNAVFSAYQTNAGCTMFLDWADGVKTKMTNFRNCPLTLGDQKREGIRIVGEVKGSTAARDSAAYFFFGKLPRITFEGNTITISPLPGKAQSSSRSCESAVQTTQQRLEKMSSITKVLVNQRDISQAYLDYPDGRSQEYGFWLEGAGVQSILTSPKLMTSLASSVIQNCSAVGLVTFALHKSGYYIAIGLFPSGQIKPFACAEDFGIPPASRESGQRAKWGMQYCSL